MSILRIYASPQTRDLNSCPMAQSWPHELLEKILEYWITEILSNWFTENTGGWESSIMNLTILNYLETIELLDKITKY